MLLELQELKGAGVKTSYYLLQMTKTLLMARMGDVCHDYPQLRMDTRMTNTNMQVYQRTKRLVLVRPNLTKNANSVYSVLAIKQSVFCKSLYNLALILI